MDLAADANAIIARFDELEDRQSYVLYQHFVHSRTLGDIAGDLDISESRVYQIFQHGIICLRGLLSKGRHDIDATKADKPKSRIRRYERRLL